MTEAGRNENLQSIFLPFIYVYEAKKVKIGSIRESMKTLKWSEVFFIIIAEYEFNMHL